MVLTIRKCVKCGNSFRGHAPDCFCSAHCCEEWYRDKLHTLEEMLDKILDDDLSDSDVVETA